MSSNRPKTEIEKAFERAFVAAKKSPDDFSKNPAGGLSARKVDKKAQDESSEPVVSDASSATRAKLTVEEQSAEIDKIVSQVVDEPEGLHREDSEREEKEKRRSPDSVYEHAFIKVQDAIKSGDIDLQEDERVTIKVPKTEKGRVILEEYKRTLNPLVSVDRTPVEVEVDNLVKDNQDELIGGIISEKVSYTPEEISQMDSSRLDAYRSMMAEGATEDTRLNAEGDVFAYRFSPTAEQIDQAKDEMAESLTADVPSVEEEVTPGHTEAPEVLEEIGRGEAIDSINSIEIEKDKDPTARELYMLLRDQLDSLTQRIDRLGNIISANNLSERNLAEDTSRADAEEAETEDSDTTVVEEVSPEEITPGSLDEAGPSEAEEEGPPQQRAVGWAGVSGANNPVAGLGGEAREEPLEATVVRVEEGESASDNLQEKMDRYLALVAGSRRWFFGRPSKEQLNEARAEYERATVDKVLLDAERIVFEKFPELAGEQREAMVRSQAASEMTYHIIDRTAAEEELQKRSFPQKAYNWLKGHPRLRLFAGLALTGGMVFSMATGNVVGAATCIAARGALAGIGTGLMVEGVADYVQTRSNQYLRNLTKEGIAEMAPDELRRVISGIGAYEVRRGRSFEGSKYKETALNVLAQQEQDLIRGMSELESQSGSTEIARGRALTEYINQMNVEREVGDTDERSKSITRGVAAVLAGSAVAIISTYLGGRSLPGENIPPSEPIIPGEPGDVPTPTPETPLTPPEATPLPPNEVTPSPPVGEIITIAESGDHIWGITENNLQGLADRLGYNLTPNQMEAAIDRGKDWYIANGFGSGPNNWLSIGDRVPFDLARGGEWLKYGMENPKL